MTDHAKTILRWAAKGVRIEDIEVALKPWHVTRRQITETITNANRQQVKQAQATPGFLEPPLFE